MALKDSPRSWGLVTRLLHWLMAIMIVGMLALGFYMARLETDLVVRFKLTQVHKSFGFTVFALGLLRLLWRASARSRPALPHAMQNWQRKAAKLSHLTLYFLMLAMPLTGWLRASASPLNDEGAFPFRVANMVFGLFELPDPLDPGSKALDSALSTVHSTLALALAVLLLGHVAAAVKHALVDRDNVLSRMARGE